MLTLRHCHGAAPARGSRAGPAAMPDLFSAFALGLGGPSTHFLGANFALVPDTCFPVRLGGGGRLMLLFLQQYPRSEGSVLTFAGSIQLRSQPMVACPPVLWIQDVHMIELMINFLRWVEHAFNAPNVPSGALVTFYTPFILLLYCLK